MAMYFLCSLLDIQFTNCVYGNIDTYMYLQTVLHIVLSICILIQLSNLTGTERLRMRNCKVKKQSL